MKGRTYRYFTGEVLYPFGYGLSYSTFAYSGLTAKRTATGAEVRATVKNTSSHEGDEVVQLYLGGGTGDDAPIRSLRGFQRIHLGAGQIRQLTFTVAAGDLPKSTVEVSVGGGQPVGSTPYVKGWLQPCPTFWVVYVVLSACAGTTQYETSASRKFLCDLHRPCIPLPMQ
jgi:beta-glucosidase